MAANGKRGNISIKDVAELAGVSPTTVSRVINNSDHPVNSKTREAVKEAIKELNFQPNRMAQGLINKKSNIIGVIVHDISDAYFAELVKGIEEVTFDYNYIVNIYNTNRDIHKELQAVNMLKANQAEAVVFTGGHLLDDYYSRQMEELIEDLKEQGCYLLGVTAHPYDIKNINIGNRTAARMITEYLLDKGHNRIAYIKGPGILNTSAKRLQGFRDAFRNRGLEVRDELLIPGDFTFEGGRKAAQEVIEYVDEITAVVSSNDETALGLIWELKQKGIGVPGDISVTGIGNIPGSKYSYPPLTTISLPLYSIGKKAGTYLISRLEEKEEIPEDIEVNIGLVERESVKIVK